MSTSFFRPDPNRRISQQARTNVVGRAVRRRDIMGWSQGQWDENATGDKTYKNMQRVVQAGFKWIRVGDGGVSGNPGAPDTASLTRVVQNAHQRGLKVLAEYLRNIDKTMPVSGGTGIRSMNNAVSNVVAIVNCGVDAIEIWNEPNLSQFNADGPDATKFVDLINTLTPFIRATNPHIPVVSGGIASFSAYDIAHAVGSSQNPYEWIQRMLAYDTSWLGKIDGIGIHPYYWTGDPTVLDHWNMPWYLGAHLTPELLVPHGAGSKPFWVTECGCPYPQSSASNPINQDAHMAAVLTAMEGSRAAGTIIGPMFLYNDIGNVSQDGHDFGTYDSNGNTRPLLDVWKAEGQLPIGPGINVQNLRTV